MRHLILSSVCALSLLLFSCKKSTVPAIDTSDIVEISQTTALSGGAVTDDGGTQVTSMGICWNSAETPTTDDNKTIVTTTTGSFSAIITGLLPNMTYHVRAYAVNGTGTGYGNEVTFKTLPVAVPAVNTLTPDPLYYFSVRTGGNVTSDFEGHVTQRGVCWGKSHNPTVSDYKTADGEGTGSFISYINFLAPNTTYYLRAYATNIAGTGYGNEITVTVPDYPVVFNPGTAYGTVSDIENNSYKTVQIGTQVWMAENLKTSKYNDGSPVPEVKDNSAWKDLATPGFCWLNNDEGFKNQFGALYNFYAVATGKLCPSGWHVPDQSELTALNYNLGGVAVSGGKMKETGTSHWKTPNEGATNESGFTSLPASTRENVGNFFPVRLSYTCWWLSSVYIHNSTDAFFFSVNNESPRLQDNSIQSKNAGFSVRCVKN
jgi:uncharacterized protein (TIGR02145 family)